MSIKFSFGLFSDVGVCGLSRFLLRLAFRFKVTIQPLAAKKCRSKFINMIN